MRVETAATVRIKNEGRASWIEEFIEEAEWWKTAKWWYLARGVPPLTRLITVLIGPLAPFSPHISLPGQQTPIYQSEDRVALIDLRKIVPGRLSSAILYINSTTLYQSGGVPG